MAISIENGIVKPALKYNFFFMEELNLSQKWVDDNTAQPEYSLKVRYRLFAVDEDGKRHPHQKVDHITMPDYYAEAYRKALLGDMDLANAAGAIEKAMAVIISEQTTLGSAALL